MLYLKGVHPVRTSIEHYGQTLSVIVQQEQDAIAALRHEKTDEHHLLAGPAALPFFAQPLLTAILGLYVPAVAGILSPVVPAA